MLFIVVFCCPFVHANELNLDPLRAAFQDSAAEQQQSDNKAIYGDDDRQEVVKASPRLQMAARSVAALFTRDELAVSTGGQWQLPKNPTLRELQWCPDERFSQQLAAAKCTGFLTAPDRLVTSAHCVRSDNKPFDSGLPCSSVSVVFDYAMPGDGGFNSGLEPSQIYQCSEVLARYIDPGGGADWSIIRLDRKVPDRVPLDLYLSDSLPETSTLSVIGHPLGLPAKVSANAKVLEQSREGYFVTDLDTYQGNSGSPVLMTQVGAEKLVVVGILSRGDQDYDTVVLEDGQSCQRSRLCSDSICQGEHVTRITQLPSVAYQASIDMDATGKKDF